jgi:DNA-binding transcriptional LysR family regulator
LRSYRISELLGTVVAAPELAAQIGTASEPRELPMVCLNRLENHTRETLTHLGLQISADRALRVDNYTAVVQAAREGLGVAIVYTTPGAPLELGAELVPLSRDPIHVPFAMYFVCRAADAEQPDMIALREWLTECILG